MIEKIGKNLFTFRAGHVDARWHIYFIYFIYYIYINGSSALPIWEGVIDPLIRRAL